MYIEEDISEENSQIIKEKDMSKVRDFKLLYIWIFLNSDSTIYRSYANSNVRSNA